MLAAYPFLTPERRESEKGGAASAAPLYDERSFHKSTHSPPKKSRYIPSGIFFVYPYGCFCSMTRPSGGSCGRSFPPPCLSPHLTLGIPLSLIELAIYSGERHSWGDTAKHFLIEAPPFEGGAGQKCLPQHGRRRYPTHRRPPAANQLPPFQTTLERGGIGGRY